MTNPHTDSNTYSIEVLRPDGLSDAQWKAFCGLMDAEDFEDKCLWDAVDDIAREVTA